MQEKHYQEYPEITMEKVNEALEFCTNQVLGNLPEFTDQFQNAYSVGGFYQPIENTEWTNGFWTGELWLAYEYCMQQGKKLDAVQAEEYFQKAQSLKHSAEIQIDSFLNRIDRKISVDHHDMGFLYSPSCVAGYQLIGSSKGREAAIKAADQLITRFRPIGEFIQAWGRLNEPSDYRLIIDCLLNLPLLYWASQETGEEKYKEIAQKHIHTAVANVIREDYSTWHTFYFDPETGKPHHGATCQGYRDGSAWARGQAWGVYGMALAYKYTQREEYINIFREVTRYFLEHLPNDLVPYWDLEFGEGSTEPRDSSSASIVACGMLEMAKYLETEEAKYYRSMSRKLLNSLAEHYQVMNATASNGLVLHSTYSNHSPYNTCNHCGVDECNIWGDYFYMEALTRLSKNWELYW